MKLRARAGVGVETIFLYSIAGMLGAAGTLVLCVVEVFGLEPRAMHAILVCALLAVSLGTLWMARFWGDPPFGPMVASSIPMLLFAGSGSGWL